MALILSIETTTTNCSVALGKDGELIALKEYNSKSYSHAEKLHPFIAEVLETGGCQLSDLDAIAVSKGPGSYTGLRIGVSAAKGLCFSLDIPLLAIETLKTLLEDINDRDTYFMIHPMLDARRMEVYTTAYSPSQNSFTPTEAKVLDETAYQEELIKGKLLFIGTGIEKFKNICPHPNAYFKPLFPSAKAMTKLVEEKFQKKDFEDLAYFEPFYLKDFIGKKVK